MLPCPPECRPLVVSSSKWGFDLLWAEKTRVASTSMMVTRVASTSVRGFYDKAHRGDSMSRPSQLKVKKDQPCGLRMSRYKICSIADTKFVNNYSWIRQLYILLCICIPVHIYIFIPETNTPSFLLNRGSVFSRAREPRVSHGPCLCKQSINVVQSFRALATVE